jgi:hypothetical protein
VVNRTSLPERLRLDEATSLAAEVVTVIFGVCEDNELFKMANGERAEEDGVEDAEDVGVGVAPRASVRIAIKVKPGLFASMRTA